jgi:hypothetical protein
MIMTQRPVVRSISPPGANKERDRPGPVEKILGGEPPPFLEAAPMRMMMKTQRPMISNSLVASDLAENLKPFSKLQCSCPISLTTAKNLDLTASLRLRMTLGFEIF